MSASWERISVPTSIAQRNLLTGNTPGNRLVELYGEFKGGRDRKWSDDATTILQRKNIHRREPSYKALSVETGGTSGHYDIVGLDDPTTTEQIIKFGSNYHDKAWLARVALNGLLKPTSLFYLPHTRYAQGDVPGRIAKNEVGNAVIEKFGELPPDFDQDMGWMRYAHLAGWHVIYTDVDSTDADGNVTYNFPTIWNEETIKQVRAQGVQGEAFYWTQLKNRPSKREDRPINEHHIEMMKCSMSDVPKAAFQCLVMVGDMAHKDHQAYAKQSGDRSVIQIWALHGGQAWLVWQWTGRVQSAEFDQQYLRALQWSRLNHDFKPSVSIRRWGYGTPKGGQGTWADHFKRISANNGYVAPAISEIHETRNKWESIMDSPLASHVQDGSIHVVEGLPGNSDLFYQLLHWDTSEYDDAVDAMHKIFHPSIWKVQQHGHTHLEDPANSWAPNVMLKGGYDDSGRFVPTGYGNRRAGQNREAIFNALARQTTASRH
jgi:hypothetical protein